MFHLVGFTPNRVENRDDQSFRARKISTAMSVVGLIASDVIDVHRDARCHFRLVG
jgi:hypothetical protein